MLSTLWDKFTGKTTEAKNAAACAVGRHRWTTVIEKLEDGTSREWRVCQSCGETEE